MSVPALVPPARWWSFVNERRVFCPHGHHIPFNAKIPEHGFIRCPQKTLPDRKQSCGCWVFLYAIRGGRIVVVQVTEDEMEEMNELQTPAAMIDYLGIFPT